MFVDPRRPKVNGVLNDDLEPEGEEEEGEAAAPKVNNVGVPGRALIPAVWSKCPSAPSSTARRTCASQVRKLPRSRQSISWKTCAIPVVRIA